MCTRGTGKGAGDQRPGSKARNGNYRVLIRAVGPICGAPVVAAFGRMTGAAAAQLSKTTQTRDWPDGIRGSEAIRQQLDLGGTVNMPGLEGVRVLIIEDE